MWLGIAFALYAALVYFVIAPMWLEWTIGASSAALGIGLTLAHFAASAAIYPLMKKLIPVGGETPPKSDGLPPCPSPPPERTPRRFFSDKPSWAKLSKSGQESPETARERLLARFTPYF